MRHAQGNLKTLPATTDSKLAFHFFVPARHDESPVANLEQLLKRLGQVAQDRERVTLGTILHAVGRRSFAPLLLIAGLIALSPLEGPFPVFRLWWP